MLSLFTKPFFPIYLQKCKNYTPQIQTLEDTKFASCLIWDLAVHLCVFYGL